MEHIEYVEPREIAGLGAGIVIPKRLDENSCIIAIKKHDKVAAFLYFTRFEKYIHINYSFTCPPYRKQGFSLMLRNHLIEYAKCNDIPRLLSVPFENANSVSLLKKLGFLKDYNNDSYVLVL